MWLVMYDTSPIIIAAATVAASVAADDDGGSIITVQGMANALSCANTPVRPPTVSLLL